MSRIDIGHGLALSFTKKSDETVPSDVWIQFSGDDGKKSAALSIAATAERCGPVIGNGLRAWASDRIDEHMANKIADEEAAEEAAAGGQFGAGA